MPLALDMAQMSLADMFSSPNALAEAFAEFRAALASPSLSAEYRLDPALLVAFTASREETDIQALYEFAAMAQDTLHGAAAECIATLNGQRVEFAEVDTDIFELSAGEDLIGRWQYDGSGLVSVD